MPNVTYKCSGAFTFLDRSGACRFVQGPGDAVAHPMPGAVPLACRKAGQSLHFCQILQKSISAVMIYLAVSTELVPSSHRGQSYSIQGKRSCWTQRFKAAALLPCALARSLTVPEESEVVRSLRCRGE